MKLWFTFLLVGGFSLQMIFGGVIHESKTKVTFGDFGEYATHVTVWVQGLQQRKESVNEFKASGMMGEMIGRFMAKEKHKGEIIDLQGMKVYEIYHDRKQYREYPIEKISSEEMAYEQEYAPGDEEEEEESSESNVKIIRQVFKVVPTGKQKTINQFPCQEYQIFWVTEWENVETGEKGKDSLFTEVWATKAGSEAEKALQEEQQFQQKYLEKVGLEFSPDDQSILGLNWLQMFRQMNQQQSAIHNEKEAQFVKELQKIEGLPVLIEGQYFATRPGQNKEMAQSEDSGIDLTNPGGMFGGFLKKKLKAKAQKKARKGKQANVIYRTELIKLQTIDVPQNKFQVPSGYTLIE